MIRWIRLVPGIAVIVPLLFLLPPGPLHFGSSVSAPGSAPPRTDGTALLAQAYASLAAGPAATPGNRTWTDQLAPTPSNYLHAVYDGADGYVLLVDPYDGKSWGFVGGHWMQVAGASASPRLDYAELAYDAHDGYVVAFGVGGSCYSSCNATWTYRAGVWTNLTPNLTVSPRGRTYAEMAYDSHDGYVVLWSGYEYTCNPYNPNNCYTTIGNDTWTFAGGAWTRVATSVAPPGVIFTSLVDDPSDGYVVMFGGYGNCDHNNGVSCGDTWTFAGGNWTLRLGWKATHPAARETEVLTLDPASGDVLLFGGYSSVARFTPALNDTWLYHKGKWTQIYPNATPLNHIGLAAATDPADREVVTFGGGASNYPNQTWFFRGGNWTPLAPLVAPPASFLPAMTNDLATHQVLLFGGASPSSPRGQTWGYATGTWTRLHPATSPSARFGAALMYDPKDKIVLLFGGCGTGGNPTSCPTVLGDTWSYAGGTWTNLTGGLTATPGPRYGASMTYDSTDGYVVMFGGCGTTSACLLNDTWRFVSGNWSRVPTAMAPSPREYSAMTNDPTDHAVVLFGGCGGSACPLGDTWRFSAGNWTLSHPTGAPLARYGAAIWYDAADGYVLLEGGVVDCGSSHCLNGASWAYAGGNWTKLVPLNSPPIGAFAGRAYDGTDGYSMLFGGCTTAICSTASSDTWDYLPR